MPKNGKKKEKKITQRNRLTRVLRVRLAEGRCTALSPFSQSKSDDLSPPGPTMLYTIQQQDVEQFGVDKYPSGTVVKFDFEVTHPVVA